MSAADILGFVSDLKIVSTGDGLDVTLSENQIASLRRTMLSAVDGSNSIRVTNIRKVLDPVLWKLTWPYAVGIGACAFVLGYALSKSR